MTDQLENRPPIQKTEIDSVELDLTRSLRRQICNFIGGGRSFELHVPQSAVDTFLQKLGILFRDEENGVPAYAEHLGRRVPEIRIIDQSRADFEQSFSELRDNREKYRHLTPWGYADQVHELNIWINPDSMYLTDQEDVATFSKMAKYAQNLYLFDHDVSFGQLSPHLQKALGGESDIKLIIQQKIKL